MNDDDDSTTVAMTGQATGAQDARDGRAGHEGESRRARRAGRAGREPRQDAAHRAGPCRSRRAGRPRRAAAPQGTSPRPLAARCPWAPVAGATRCPRGLQGARAPSGWLRRRAGDEAGAPWLDQGREGGGDAPRRAAEPGPRKRAVSRPRRGRAPARRRAGAACPHCRAGAAPARWESRWAARTAGWPSGHRAGAAPGHHAGQPSRGRAPGTRAGGGGRLGVEVGEEGRGDWWLREVRVVGENQGRAVRKEEEEVGAPDRRARRLGRLGEGAP
jgi:hypothetical protein